MTCPDTLGALDAYLDNELSVMDILRVQGHLLRCDRCRAVAESEGVLHSLLAADAVQDEPSAQLRERILQQIGELPPPARPAPAWRRWSGRTAIGLACAALVVGTVVGVVLGPALRGPERIGPIVEEVVAKHALYDAQGPATLQRVTGDRVALAVWLEGRLGFSIKAPSGARPGDRLLGGRLSSLADTPAAYLVYQWGPRRISLFVAQVGNGEAQGGRKVIAEGVELYSAALRGITVTWWEDAELLYLAAAAGGERELREFALLCARSGRLGGFAPATAER